MKSYTYKFADGTRSTVIVEDELYDLLTEMDRQERYGNRREMRRHVSMEKLVEKSVEPTVTDEHFTDSILEHIDDKRLHKGISELLPQQQYLLNRHFVQGLTVKDIAEQDGIAVCSVSNKFRRIYKKLENFS